MLAVQANPEARILVVTSFAQDDKVFPAIVTGAHGHARLGHPGSHSTRLPEGGGTDNYPRIKPP